MFDWLKPKPVPNWGPGPMNLPTPFNGSNDYAAYDNYPGGGYQPIVHGPTALERLRMANRDQFGMPDGLPPSGNGMPGTHPAPSYPMADPMNSGAYPAPSAPLPPSRPSPLIAQNPVHTSANPQIAATSRPSAPATAAPQAPSDPNHEGGWIDPAILFGQNRAELAKQQGQQPQTSYASMNSKPSKPGEGLLSFMGSGAVPVFKQSDLTPPDFQGPVLPHENTGKRVGVLEGSPAAQFQDSPVFKLMSLFGGGGF